MYSIGEISKMFQLPISTLRYYDKEGLFPPNGMNLRKILFLKFVPLLLCLSY